MWHNDANPGPISDTQSCYIGQERRAAPRIETPFPATVRSIDIDDQPFEAHTVLDNLSSCGLYLRLAWRVPQGSRLFVVVRLSAVPNVGDSTAGIALRGVVLRTEPRPGGVFGTALRLTRHRFIDTKFRPELSQTAWTYSVRRTSDRGRMLREAGD
jgi:hypothetical protein